MSVCSNDNLHQISFDSSKAVYPAKRSQSRREKRRRIVFLRQNILASPTASVSRIIIHGNSSSSFFRVFPCIHCPLKWRERESGKKEKRVTKTDFGTISCLLSILWLFSSDILATRGPIWTWIKSWQTLCTNCECCLSIGESQLTATESISRAKVYCHVSNDSLKFRADNIIWSSNDCDIIKVCIAMREILCQKYPLIFVSVLLNDEATRYFFSLSCKDGTKHILFLRWWAAIFSSSKEEEKNRRQQQL